MSAARRVRSSAPPGLVWRGKRAYFDRRHARFENGRLAISLRTGDPLVAAQRHAALCALMDRGDWAVLEAVRAGELHVSDVVAALREGETQKLRRLGAESPKLGAAVEQFLQRKQVTRAAGTAENYRLHLEKLVGHFGADFELAALTAQAAQRYLEALGYAPSTLRLVRNRCAALWSAVLAEEQEALEARNVVPIVRTNPWLAVELPEVRPTRAVFLLPEEWLELAAAVKDKPHAALLGLAYLAGLRSAEIRHLRSDVDVVLRGHPDAPLVRVQARKGAHPWQPKTARSERDVPLVPNLVEIIDRHRALGYAGQRYLIRAPGQDRPLSATTASAWTAEAYKAAGIEYGREGDALTLHSGRHTFASWLAQDGVPLNVIADLCGNSMEEVQRTYAHLVPNTYRAALASVERRAQGGRA